MGASGVRESLIRNVFASLQNPSTLSFFRIGVSPFFYHFLTHNNWIALPVFITACITDVVDGYFARKLGKTSDHGAIIDAIADFTLISFAYINFVSRGLYPIWILLLTTVALIQFVFTYRLFRKPDPLGRYIGTVLYISIFLTLIPIGNFHQPLLWITSTYIIVSMILRWGNNLGRP